MGKYLAHLKPFRRPSKTATLEAEHRVADDVAPAYAAAMLAGFHEARAVSLSVARQAFESGNVHAFERVIDWTPIKAAMQRRCRQASETAIVAAARAHARLLPKKLWKQDESDAERQAAEDAALQQLEVAVGTAFNLRNPYAIRWADQHAAELVSEVTWETEAAVRAIVLRMWNEGLTVDQAAREIRRIIGLTERQAIAVENYRLGFDPATDPSIVERRVEDYAQRSLRQRADLIARTEGIRASVAGQQVLWDEASNAGILERDRTFQQWLVTPDEKLAVVGPKTKVLTQGGWRPVSDIRIGDFVLTHKDRFRRVMQAVGKWYAGPTVKLTVGCREVRGVHVTYGHPILVRRNGAMAWVVAEEVCENDWVFLNGVPCVGCGTVLPSGSRSKAERYCHSCNVVRQNASLAVRETQHDAVVAFNAQRWSRTGERERQRERASAHCHSPAARAKMSTAAKARGIYPFRDPEVQRKIQQSLQGRHPFSQSETRRKAYQSRGRNARGGSWLERKIKWFLQVQGIAFEAQWSFTYKFDGKQRSGAADFYLPGPKMVIECDGSWAHNQAKQRLRDTARDIALEALHVRVLHLSEDVILRQFDQAASAIRAACCIVAHPIKRITHTKGGARNVVYHLSVEEDESFVAGGVVVHNCPICESLGLADPVPLGTPFPTGDYGPPAHPACRCALRLVFRDSGIP